MLQKICLTLASYPVVAHNDVGLLQQGLKIDNEPTVDPKKHPRSAKEFADTVFKHGDVDENGVLDGKEINAVRKHLAALAPAIGKVKLTSIDTNGDGKLSHQEVQAMADKYAPPVEETDMPPAVEKVDTTAAADNEPTVDPKKHPRSAKEFADTVFKKGDVDKNGVLEGKEIKAVGEHLVALAPAIGKVKLTSIDTNGDGKLSHQEVQAEWLINMALQWRMRTCLQQWRRSPLQQRRRSRLRRCSQR